ncbi:MAG: sialidase family protein [Actinomycetota bacterium]
MATIAGLTYPTMVEHNGIIYVTGYRDGGVYVRRTADGGATWLKFADEAEERLICAPADEARVGLVKMESQGRRLMAAVSVAPDIAVYVSADDGETWVGEGVV